MRINHDCEWQHSTYHGRLATLARWRCSSCGRSVLLPRIRTLLLAPLRALLGLAALLTVALVCACVALAGVEELPR